MNSIQSTEEEAGRCPGCQTPGKLVNRRRVPSGPGIPPGTLLSLYECQNDRCPDFIPEEVFFRPGGEETKARGERMRWFVQLNPDGTIPPRGTGSTGPKAFEMPGMHSSTAQRARDMMKLMASDDERHGEATEIARDLGY